MKWLSQCVSGASKGIQAIWREFCLNIAGAISLAAASVPSRWMSM